MILIFPTFSKQDYGFFDFTKELDRVVKSECGERSSYIFDISLPECPGL